MNGTVEQGSVVELRPGRSGRPSVLRQDSGLDALSDDARWRQLFAEAHEMLSHVRGEAVDERIITSPDAFAELSLDYDADQRTMWVWQQHTEAIGYTPALLEDILGFHHYLRDFAAMPENDLRFLVWGSKHPGVFNLGGDLALFCELIRNGDRSRLRAYAHDCIHACYGHASNHGLPIISVAMVQGDALGGDLESVLSSDVIIAERGAKFGFPEILFGLFPAMGAYSFIARRIGAADAERMILSGKTYTTDNMLEMGLFDMVVDTGQAPLAVRQYINESQKKFAGLMSVYAARRRVNPVTLDEMMDIVDLWVDAALTLEDSMIRRMDLLVRAQKRQMDVSRQKSARIPAQRA